jgi:hypothetical protein
MSPRLRPQSLRRRSAALAAAAAAVALVLAALGPGAAPAGAHDGDAVVAIEATHPAGLSMHYIVRVTWANDGHPVTDGTITATAVGADGTQLTPVPLTPIDQEGRYEGVVPYPSAGTWTVRITSVEPNGTLEEPQEITAPAPTEPDEVTPEVSTGQEGGFAPGDDGTGDSGELGEDATAAQSDDGGSDSGMPLALIVGAAAVALVGAATAVNIIRRRRGVPPAGDGAGPDSGGNGSDGSDAAGTPHGSATTSTTGAGAANDPTAAGS